MRGDYCAARLSVIARNPVIGEGKTLPLIRADDTDPEGKDRA
jgi:hypothetical protein